MVTLASTKHFFLNQAFQSIENEDKAWSRAHKIHIDAINLLQPGPTETLNIAIIVLIAASYSLVGELPTNQRYLKVDGHLLTQVSIQSHMTCKQNGSRVVSGQLKCKRVLVTGQVRHFSASNKQKVEKNQKHFF